MTSFWENIPGLYGVLSWDRGYYIVSGNVGNAKDSKVGILYMIRRQCHGELSNLLALIKVTWITGRNDPHSMNTTPHSDKWSFNGESFTTYIIIMIYMGSRDKYAMCHTSVIVSLHIYAPTAQFSLSNVHKGGMKQHNFIYFSSIHPARFTA